jgi:2-amino-4-hydroxy-6-hydroxymethyldihydropteridine diphosphokinase
MRDNVAQCAIALGSNLGDSNLILDNAIHILSETPKIKVKSYSKWYQTVAMGPPQPDYLNGCALLDVGLTPQEVLETLLKIEKHFGRERRERWGPRTLDLDLLLFEDLIIDSPTLKIPHPHMRERDFVLIPLAEIAPEWVDPVTGMAIADLLDQLSVYSDLAPSKKVTGGERQKAKGKRQND